MKNLTALIFSLLSSLAYAQTPSLADLWFHSNVGQPLQYDIDSYSTESIKGLPGFDTGITLPLANKPVGKNEIIIAVLDTGADITHPYLKDSLAYNQVECVGNMPPMSATEDKDQNGFKGDCIGLDFTKNPDDKSFHRVTDNNGHGTHVSGIIASFSRYSDYPIFKKIKVLPLKVVGAKESLGKTVSSALEYAYRRGARVVNFSMGWPQTGNSGQLKKSIELAQSRGMIIVAAAGNNAHNSALFPCNYKGVICVGSSQNDGERSRFSNFGAHVDFSAPGSQILSSVPYTVKLKLSSLTGFDKKSGTSQAAPIISTYVAAILSQSPELTRDDLYHRLASSAKKANDQYSLNGFPRFQDLFERPTTSVSLIEFKEHVQINMTDKKIQFPIDLVKFGAEPQALEIEYSVKTAGYELERESDSLRMDQLHERKSLNLNIFCKDLMADSFLNLEVTIKSPNSTKTILLNTQIMRESELQKIDGQFRASDFGQLNSITGAQSRGDKSYFIAIKGTRISLFELKTSSP